MNQQNSNSFLAIDVVSAATGILMRRDGFSELHRCVECVAGGPVFTHMLPAAFRQIRPLLLSQHPWIRLVRPRPDKDEDVATWLEMTSEALGEWRVTVEAAR